jgi:hypothetical protein
MRTVPLDRQGRYLKFDIKRGVIRMAYWWPEVVKGKQVGEQRCAVQRKTLRECLAVVLGEAEGNGAPFDPATVEAYIREVPGGRELP